MAQAKAAKFRTLPGEQQAKRLAKLYGRAQSEIEQKLALAIAKSGGDKTKLPVRTLEQQLKAAKKMLKALNKTGSVLGAEMVTAAFNGGVAVARSEMKAAGIPLVAEMNGIHEKAMKVYASQVASRLADVVNTAGRTVEDIYKKLELDSVLTGTVSGYNSINETIRKMDKAAASEGIVGFVDKAGRQWNMASYVEMLGRTSVMKIHNEATWAEFKAHGEDLIQVSSHLPTCEMCVPWNGAILSLTGSTPGYPTLADAEAAGLFHPNCRHASSLYIPDENSVTPMASGSTANQQAAKTPFDDLNITGTENWKFIKGAHGIEECYNTVNPNYSTGADEWTRNCQRCVPTYEMRRRGYDVVAKPRVTNGIDVTASHWRDIFENAQWRTLSGSGKGAIKTLMKQWGDGARAEVYVAWKVRGTHVFVVENVNGKIHYLCPQSADKDCVSWFSKVRRGMTSICRIDNLKPSGEIIECCNPV